MIPVGPLRLIIYKGDNRTRRAIDPFDEPRHDPHFPGIREVEIQIHIFNEQETAPRGIKKHAVCLHSLFQVGDAGK